VCEPLHERLGRDINLIAVDLLAEVDIEGHDSDALLPQDLGGQVGGAIGHDGNARRT